MQELPARQFGEAPVFGRVDAGDELLQEGGPQVKVGRSARGIDGYRAIEGGRGLRIVGRLEFRDAAVQPADEVYRVLGEELGSGEKNKRCKQAHEDLRIR